MYELNLVIIFRLAYSLIAVVLLAVEILKREIILESDIFSNNHPASINH